MSDIEGVGYGRDQWSNTPPTPSSGVTEGKAESGERIPGRDYCPLDGEPLKMVIQAKGKPTLYIHADGFTWHPDASGEIRTAADILGQLRSGSPQHLKRPAPPEHYTQPPAPADEGKAESGEPVTAGLLRGMAAELDRASFATRSARMQAVKDVAADLRSLADLVPKPQPSAGHGPGRAAGGDDGAGGRVAGAVYAVGAVHAPGVASSRCPPSGVAGRGRPGPARRPGAGRGRGMRAHDVISVALTASGMSQAQLAQRCGLSAKHVNQFMRGKVPVSARVAILLDEVLGLNPVALIAMELNAEIERARAGAPAPRGQADGTSEEK